MFDFQPMGKNWEERSLLKGDKSVLDPEGTEFKNSFIDRLQKRAIRETLLSVNRRDSCLDFGCGIGRLHDLIAEFFLSYRGVDVTASMIKKARVAYADEFYTYNGLDLPIADDSMDAVLSVLVLQHINDSEEYEKIVGEFRRVTKLGGNVIFIEQINGTRTYDHYTRPFQQNGFTLRTFRLIRRGKSISSWIASRTWCEKLPTVFAESVLRFLNDVEILFPPIKATYEECIFVFRRDR